MLESCLRFGSPSVLIHTNAGYARNHRESMPCLRPGSEINSSLNLRVFGFPPVMSEQNQQLPLNLHRLVTSITGGKLKVLNVLKKELKDKVVFEVVLNNKDKRLNGKKFSIKKKFLNKIDDNVSVYTARHKVDPQGIELFLMQKKVDKQVVEFAKQNAINLLWAFKNVEELDYDYSDSVGIIALSNIKESDIVYFNSRATMDGVQFWANQESLRKNNGRPSWMKSTGENKQVIPKKSRIVQTVISDFRVDECDCCFRVREVKKSNTNQFICDECFEDDISICKPCGYLHLEENLTEMYISESARKKFGLEDWALICEDCKCEVE